MIFIHKLKIFKIKEINIKIGNKLSPEAPDFASFLSEKINNFFLNLQNIKKIKLKTYFVYHLYL